MRILSKELKTTEESESQEAILRDPQKGGTDVVINDYKDLEIEKVESSRDSSLIWGLLE